MKMDKWRVVMPIGMPASLSLQTFDDQKRIPGRGARPNEGRLVA